MPLSCKNASALDSLPRQSNVKRSSSALNRLQQRKQAFQLQSRPGEFGRPIKKSVSKRTDSKSASKGLASDDLPLASSDLYNDDLLDRGAFSDGDDDEEDEEKRIHLLSAMRPRSTSPTKSMRRLRAPQSEVDSVPSSPKAPLSPIRRIVPVPAQKRIIRKDMISSPSNFQHTGHIGAASYTALQTVDAEKIRLQLSEVAAALNFADGDHFSLSSTKPALVVRGVSQGSETTLAGSIGQESEKQVVEVSEGKGEQPREPESTVARAAETSPSKDASPLIRAASKRKPVPGPRNLALLYSEFRMPADSDSLANTSNTTQPIIDPLPAITQEEEEKSVVKPLPTIRAPNGKRLVPGPAGDYITDTANGRWNNALHEITNALKAEGGIDDDMEEEDLQDGLRRADAILNRLGASQYLHAKAAIDLDDYNEMPRC